MPLLALSAKARLMVPVGALDSRCELRSPCWRMRSQRLRQARREIAGAEVQVGIEQRERPALARQLHRRGVGRVAQRLGDAPCALARGVTVVVQPQHHQRIAQAGEAQADAALVPRLLGLLRQRPHGGVEHVVQHAHRHRGHLGQPGLVEGRIVLEGPRDEMRQVDAAQAAAAVARQGLLAAGVGRADGLAVTQVVVLVDAVQEQHARFGVVVGAAHDLVPQRAGAHAAVDPQAVGALEGAGLLLRRAGLGTVHQVDLGVVLHRTHEGVGDADRDVEVLQVALVLGVDEGLDVGMVAAQHAHLRAAPAAGRFHRLAAAVEDAHVADRAAGAAARAAHPRALRRMREVVTTPPPRRRSRRR